MAVQNSLLIGLIQNAKAESSHTGGLTDGTDDGVELGCAESEGVTEGTLLGTSDGPTDGIMLGEIEGIDDGIALG